MDSMKHTLGLALLSSSLLWSAGAAAQTYKCANEAGKVTYTSTKCSDLGLKDAGEVRDQLNVSPAQKVEPYRPPPAAATPKPAPAAAQAPAKAKVPDDMPPDTIIEEGRDDGRRCFTVKTAKGTSTRCNDKPD